jgi:hypothetical protein
MINLFSICIVAVNQLNTKHQVKHLYEPLNLISLGFFKMGAVVDGRSGDPEPLLIGL